MSIKNFINYEFKQYADYDNKRNIPSLMDGLKISQRKILWTFIKVFGSNETVVDRAAMRAAEFTFYKHGGQNLYSVITNMAQNFAGSNNLNLLEPIGQFGTRMIKSASSPRYISTKLNDNFKKLFNSEDFAILKNQIDEGQEIEPEFLLPKLPLQLINGSSGVGNGFACDIMSYNPKDVTKAIQEVLKYGKVKTRLIPWMNGFKGAIRKDPVTNQILIAGLIAKKDSNTLIITELPPSMQLDKYKAILNQLVEDKVIKDYENRSTEDGWLFTIDCHRSLAQSETLELLNTFKLIDKVTETLTCWLPDGNIKSYSTVEELLADWVFRRLEFFELRRLNQISVIDEQLVWLNTKAKFIRWWNENASSLVTLKSKDLIELVSTTITENEDHINRLMSIRVSNLGIEHVSDLEDEIDDITTEKEALVNTDEVEMMTKEIKALKF